jgi:predicted ATPase/DNA-binding SARP family transcriptional activator
MAIEFGVLGPLEARHGSALLEISRPKQRLLLTLLLVQANEVVSVDALIDGLWSATPPGSAMGLVHTYVSQLRKALEPPAARAGPSQPLRRADGGYRLVVEAEHFDAARFEVLLEAGRRALAEQRPRVALGMLDVAAALWRGPAFGEFGNEPAVLPAAERLGELRRLALEYRADAAIALGRHAELIGELEARLRDDPLRERTWAQLMLCLYRSGRQADALGAYQRLRHRLGDELGLEPSAALRKLETDILQQLPSLDWLAPADEAATAPADEAATAPADEAATAPAAEAAPAVSRPHPDRVPGNLPVPATSFIGRETDVKAVASLVPDHRLVTLVGAGGVGKTRLALQAAAEVATEFPDGVWFVELAPIGDPSAVADAVATALGVTRQAGLSVPESVWHALAGRKMLLVLDNCEHLLQAAADLVESMIARATSVKVLTTSREGLRVAGECQWPVPPLDCQSGTASDAVGLFVERAHDVCPGFGLTDADDAAAVVEICERLDGIALAVELAAARMVSMSPQELLGRLDHRFRLLTGPRRGLERHQTLRHTVAWSYDLLDEGERAVLRCCSIFSGSFDVAAATYLEGGDADDYRVLDLLDALVRKSMVTAERIGARTRYGMLETIRQYALEQLGVDAADDLRNRHARYFAARAIEQWTVWSGPRQREALDWVEAELANLRAGFRWASGHGDVQTATAIAAHTALLMWPLQYLEPVGWAIELLAEAKAADLPQLPRLYTAASLCSLLGAPDAAREYAEAARALERVDGYEPFDPGLTGLLHAAAELFLGSAERWVEICAELAGRSGLTRAIGLSGMLMMLPLMGRIDEAKAILADTLDAVRAAENSNFVAYAMIGQSRTLKESEPERSVEVLRECLDYCREHRLVFVGLLAASDAAGVEAVHGDPEEALGLFSAAIEQFHGSGNRQTLAMTLAQLAVFLAETGEAEGALLLCGFGRHHAVEASVPGVGDALGQLRLRLGDDAYEARLARGEALSPAEATRIATDLIRTVRRNVAAAS